MAAPNQPELPPVATQAIQELGGSIPMMNTAAALPPMFHIPQIVQPGRYAVPPPAMHGGPQLPFGFSDIFAGGRHMQDPGNVGFQQPQQIPFFGSASYNSMGFMALNTMANFGMNMLAGRVPGGEAMAQGLIPFGGLQTSRMDFLRMRERQMLMDQMFSGENNFFRNNPDLQLFGGMGLMSSPLGQMGVGMLSGYRTRMEMYAGNLGRAFGGSPMERMQSALQVGSALDSAMTLRGGGLNYGLTQGQGYGAMAGDITAAYRRGAFITDQDFNRLAGAVSRGDRAGAKRLGRQMVGDVADVMAMGRDVFGQDATADDVISGLENIFGREGVTDAGQAAQRLREIEAASEVLNMDSKTVAKYMQAMKQLTRNAGLIGEAGTNASLGLMMQGEVARRSGSARGINVDVEGVVTDRVNAMEVNLASQDANQKEALVQVLRSTQKDVLANISLGQIGGRSYTGLQALNRINAGLANENMTAEERAQLESFMGQAVNRLNQAGGPAGRALANRLRDFAAFPQDEMINMINEQRGLTGYKGMVGRSGMTMLDIDRTERAVEMMTKELAAGGVLGEKVIRGSGGPRKFLERVAKTGYFDASMSGDNEAAVRVLREEFKGLSDKEFDTMLSGLGSAMLGVARDPEVEGYQEILGSLAAVGRAGQGGAVLGEFLEAQSALEGFSAIAGGMPMGGPGQLGARFARSFMREINRKDSDTPLKERIGRLLGETTGSARVTAFTKVLEGQLSVKDAEGNDMTFKDLQDRIQGVLGRKGMSRGDRDTAIAEMTTDFWTRVGQTATGKDLVPKDPSKQAREGTATKEEKDNVLGSALNKVISEWKDSQVSNWDELMQLLRRIAKAMEDQMKAAVETS